MTAAIWPADADHIREAGRRMRAGGVVVFPTDTVYGIGCRALDAAALGRLYSVKRRPAEQPVVLLVADQAEAERWAALDVTAMDLMEQFWPGPLTLVLRAKAGMPQVGPQVATVALRMPKHEAALALIQETGEAIASSSANHAGEPPPSSAREAAAALRDEVDLILDGGPAPIGTASTILDLSGGAPHILRQGVLTHADLFGR